jgi:hypothetical protein
MIELMQKWDLNTGGSSKKATMTTATSPGVMNSNLATPYEKTFSFFTYRLYIEALLRKCRFEDFFATCLELSFTFANYVCSDIFIRHLESDGMEIFCKNINEQIRESDLVLDKVKTEIMSHTGAKIEEMIASNLKKTRESLCQIIRVTAIFMKVTEMKLTAEVRSVMGKCLSLLSFMAPTSTNNILKCFETLKRGQESEGFLK